MGYKTRRKTHCDGCGKAIMFSYQFPNELCPSCKKLEKEGKPLLSDLPRAPISDEELMAKLWAGIEED